MKHESVQTKEGFVGDSLRPVQVRLSFLITVSDSNLSQTLGVGGGKIGT